MEVFKICDKNIMPGNIVQWFLDEEFTSLDKLSVDCPDDVNRTISAYVQQLSFHAKFNVAAYKEKFPNTP